MSANECHFLVSQFSFLHWSSLTFPLFYTFASFAYLSFHTLLLHWSFADYGIAQEAAAANQAAVNP